MKVGEGIAEETECFYPGLPRSLHRKKWCEFPSGTPCRRGMGVWGWGGGVSPGWSIKGGIWRGRGQGDLQVRWECLGLRRMGTVSPVACKGHPWRWGPQEADRSPPQSILLAPPPKHAPPSTSHLCCLHSGLDPHHCLPRLIASSYISHSSPNDFFLILFILLTLKKTVVK